MVIELRLRSQFRNSVTVTCNVLIDDKPFINDTGVVTLT